MIAAPPTPSPTRQLRLVKPRVAEGVRKLVLMPSPYANDGRHDSRGIYDELEICQILAAVEAAVPTTERWKVERTRADLLLLGQGATLQRVAIDRSGRFLLEGRVYDDTSGTLKRLVSESFGHDPSYTRTTVRRR